jgi:hypothetical protein
LSRQLEWGLQEKCFKVLKAVQDAFFHFFSMVLNGAYASKFETGWEPAPQGYFFYFDKTTEVTIIQLVTILPIYKVQKI